MQFKPAGESEERAAARLGILEPKSLILELRRASQERAIACFDGSTSHYALDSEAAPGQAARSMKWDPLHTLCKALCEYYSTEQLQHLLSDHLSRYPKKTLLFRDLLDRLPLGAATRENALRLDDTQTLQTNLAKNGGPPLLASYWIASQMEAISFCDTAPAPRFSQCDDAVEIEILETQSDAVKQPKTEAVDLAGSSAPETSLSPEAHELKKQILEKYAKLPELKSHELLEVPSDIEARKVKRAYLKLAKRFHPDHVLALGLHEVSHEANALFAAMTKAFDHWGDSTKPLQADDPAAAESQKIAKAELAFRRGEVLMRAGDFRSASDFFPTGGGKLARRGSLPFGLRLGIIQKATARA